MDNLVKTVLAGQDEAEVKKAKENAEAVIAERSVKKPWVLIGYPFVAGALLGAFWDLIPHQLVIKIALGMIAGL